MVIVHDCPDFTCEFSDGLILAAVSLEWPLPLFQFGR
jgi:hypothetical protein